jgi:hypothetical protein
VGARARREALLRWSPHLQADRYLQILEAVSGIATRRVPSPAWTPVVVDEPWLAERTPLAAYPPTAGATVPTAPPAPPPSLGARLRRLAGLVRDRLRDEGIVETARASGRWLRRRVSR